MKKLCFLILLIFLGNFLIAKKDSIKIEKFRGIYFNLYYPHEFSNGYSEYGKYSYYSDYIYQTKGYNFQSPGFGVGYILNKHPLFIRTDINYRYSQTNIDHQFSGAGDSKYIGTGVNSYDPITLYYDPLLTGEQFYKIKDHVKGQLNFYYLDIGFSLSGNILPSLRLYMGWRACRLIGHSFNAIQKREVGLYQVTGYSGPGWMNDSLISTEYLEFKDTEVKNMSTQTISIGRLYNCFGISYNFTVSKQLFIVDLQYEIENFYPNYEGPYSQCINFRLGYIFNYSTYFGRKKVKD